ncbi:transposable element Tc1 transposase [Trichonephila clavipes]|nr:transposable element Tc1 transposase [Trichonephila clavipes]
MRALEDVGKNGWTGGRFQRHDGNSRPRATEDREDRLIVRSTVTAPDSLLSTIRRATHTDDSRFQLCPDDHRRHVWRRPGQRADPTFTISRHTDPQPGVMIWGDISFDSRTPLVVIRDALTSQRYANDILRTVLLPFLLKYPGGLIFQQDNTRPHTAHIAMNCLTAYQTLPSTARLPGLSPVEHVWDMMGRGLHLPENVDDLAQQLKQIWQEIPQETIRVFYYSMLRHVAACIQARGWSTPYSACYFDTM